MSLVTHQVAVGGLDKNFSYLIADSVSKEAFVIDPSGDFLKVSALIAAQQYDVTGIVITHTHHDHFDQLETALKEFPAPVYVYEGEVATLAKYGEVCAVRDGTELSLGKGKVIVLHTPGHTDDSICLYIDGESTANSTPMVFTGDTLFVGGCGRTSELRVKDLYESLAELAVLPDNTIVFPGHDYGDIPHSTIGHEKEHNPYYQTKNFNEFHALRLG